MSDRHYEHLPLQSERSTRLLRLHKAGSRDLPVKGDFLEVELGKSESLSFSALSYCWEDQKPSLPLHCGDGILLITSTVHSALQELRGSDRELLVWVDSICIDQENLDEKSAQVALIGEIFTAAHQVLVWLGRWDKEMLRAVQTAKEVTMPFAKAQAAGLPTTAQLREEVEKNILALRQGSKDPEVGYAGYMRDIFDAIFDKRWFYRIWTVQEIVLPAQRETARIKLFGGDLDDDRYWVEWSIISVLGHALIQAHQNHRRGIQAMEMHNYLLAELVASQPEDMQAHNDEQRVFSFHKLLLFAREKQATDPRDRAFALFGIMQVLSIPGRTPDYRRSVEQIYTELTASCIRHDRSIRVLLEAPSDQRRPGLPSWVPDWSDYGWRHTDRFDEAINRIPDTNPEFKAAGDSRAGWTLSDARLTVRGKVIGTVTACEDAFPLPRNPGIDSSSKRADMPAAHTFSFIKFMGTSFIRDWAQPYLKLRQWVALCCGVADEGMYPTGETSLAALGRTLLQSAPPGFSKDEFLHWLKELHESKWDNLANDSWFGLVRGFGTIMWSLRSGGSDYHARAVRMSSCRTYFTTDGKLMGTAPSRKSGDGLSDLVEPGDHVAIIAGLPLPFILRSVPETMDSYQLVTHAYVHGIMYGEAWEDGQIPTIELTLT